MNKKQRGGVNTAEQARLTSERKREESSQGGLDRKNEACFEKQVGQRANEMTMEWRLHFCNGSYSGMM